VLPKVPQSELLPGLLQLQRPKCCGWLCCGWLCCGGLCCGGLCTALLLSPAPVLQVLHVLLAFGNQRVPSPAIGQ